MKKPVETLWRGYRAVALPADAPPSQVHACHLAFFAGAASLFASVMSNLSPGDDVLPQDEQYMLTVMQELEAFTRLQSTPASERPS